MRSSPKDLYRKSQALQRTAAALMACQGVKSAVAAAAGMGVRQGVREMDELDPIPEIPLVMRPESDEAHRIIGFNGASGVGERHKLGGQADWIQGDEIPICSSCSKEMTFYGQLDCIGDEVLLGDCGMIYVFYCRNCLQAAAVLQTG